MLKPFKIKSENSSNFHNIRFEILDIEGDAIKFLSPFHVRMKFYLLSCISKACLILVI
jgi:hypothetical protein